jgi:hypothetical protein
VVGDYLLNRPAITWCFKHSALPHVLYIISRAESPSGPAPIPGPVLFTPLYTHARSCSASRTAAT